MDFSGGISLKKKFFSVQSVDKKVKIDKGSITFQFSTYNIDEKKE